MNSASTLVAIGSLAALSACSTPASPAEGQAAPTQWKTVTRIVNGNSVTYRVPVNQKVPNDVNLRPFEPDQPAAKTASADRGASSAAPAAKRPAEPAPPLAASGANDPDLPWARPPGSAATEEQPKQVAQATPTPNVASTPSPGVSQEAETALGQAEIAVRDAQSRFETAQAALARARDAAQKGDSASTIKFAKTAVSLSRPGP
jgi:hypothetical protein